MIHVKPIYHTIVLQVLCVRAGHYAWVWTLSSTSSSSLPPLTMGRLQMKEREREETQSQTKLQWPGPASQVWEGPTFSCIAWWMHGKKMENWGFLPVSFREIIHLTLCCNFHSFEALLDGSEHKHSPGQTSLAPITGWPRARGWALTLVIFQSLGGEYSEILWNSGLFPNYQQFYHHWYWYQHWYFQKPQKFCGI